MKTGMPNELPRLSRDTFQRWFDEFGIDVERGGNGMNSDFRKFWGGNGKAWAEALFQLNQDFSPFLNFTSSNVAFAVGFTTALGLMHEALKETRNAPPTEA